MIEYGITLVCSNKHLNNKFIDSTILTKETIYIEGTRRIENRITEKNWGNGDVDVKEITILKTLLIT